MLLLLCSCLRPRPQIGLPRTPKHAPEHTSATKSIHYQVISMFLPMQLRETRQRLQLPEHQSCRGVSLTCTRLPLARANESEVVNMSLLSRLATNQPVGIESPSSSSHESDLPADYPTELGLVQQPAQIDSYTC